MPLRKHPFDFRNTAKCCIIGKDLFSGDEYTWGENINDNILLVVLVIVL